MNETGLAGHNFHSIIRRNNFIIERINSDYKQPQSSNPIKQFNTFQEINTLLSCHIAMNYLEVLQKFIKYGRMDFRIGSGSIYLLFSKI